MAARRISLLVLTPFLVVGAVLTFAARELAVERRHELGSAATTASDMARMIGERVNSTLIMVELLLDETVDDLDGEPAELRQRLRQRQAHAAVIDRISVYDRSLRMLVSTAASPGDRLEEACHGADGGPGVWLHPMRGDACAFSVNRSVGVGATAKVIRAELSTQVLGDLFELRRELGEGSRIALLDQDASPLIVLPADLTPEGLAAMTREIGAGFAAHGRRGYVGEDLVVGLYQLPGYPMRVLVGIDKAYVLSLWRQGLRATFLFGLVLVAGAAAWAVIAKIWQSRRTALEARLRREELQRLRAEEASRTKSQFLQYMSHELRTPLNAILGFSEIIRDRLLGEAPGRYAEYAADIHVSGSMLLDIVNDLLEIAKLESGTLVLKRERVALHELAHEAADLMRPQAQKAGLEVRTELAPCHALADRRAVMQILLNLLSNAVKYTPAGGHIVVRSTGRAEDVRVEVEDTGRGMDEATLARVLKPFEQADNRLDLARMGTGLGLAVTSGLIDTLGGRLRISSAPGRGTVAVVDLPAASEAVAAD